MRVAESSSSEVRALLIDAWQAFEGDGRPDPRAALDKLSRWIEELHDGEERSESNTVRHTLNLLFERNAGGTHNALRKRFTAMLNRYGIFEIPVQVGKRFDDSYSPNKFERRQELSSEPAGTILRVMRPGLVDRGGLPLQKAVLAVSNGKG